MRPGQFVRGLQLYIELSLQFQFNARSRSAEQAGGAWVGRASCECAGMRIGATATQATRGPGKGRGGLGSTSRHARGK
eukprot:4681163-Prymnesium_polylepis.1